MAPVDLDPDGAVLAIEAEVGSPFGRAERIEGMRAGLGAQPGREASLDRLVALAAAVARRSGDVIRPAVALLHAEAARRDDAWPLLEPLLQSAAPSVALETLDLAARLSAEGRLAVSPSRLGTLAALLEAPDSPFLGAEALARMTAIATRTAPRGEGTVPVLREIWAGSAAPPGRRLAARLLDAAGAPPGPDLAERMLGEDAARFLAPYLAYTRASHLDLLDLVPAPGIPPPALASLRRAEARCGPPLLREVLARLGWGRVNAGLAIEPCVGLGADGAFPLVLSPEEAALVEGEPGVGRVFERWLVVAHGGSLAPTEASRGPDSVAAFRSLNLLHADALADILDVAPLTSAKTERILGRMERIVEAFCGLFEREAAEECRLVLDVFRDLERRIRRELAGAPEGRTLTAEATRLVQMFEDPRTPGDVRTLHGLKRFLHQRGLRLGFRLAESGRGANRTVDLAVVAPPRVLRVVRAIAYADFEPEPRSAGEEPAIPWAVRVVAEGFGRQLLHGQELFPKARVFCYGNEVHAYLAFANHPVFLRIDLAPPLRGGMLDLEYYGVSKYELDAHPNPSLDGLLRFFRRLDVAAEVENTRIHARYDKERASDLSDLCERVEALFRLAPYLMDVDWVIGGLSLDDAARGRVAEAWADFFARWGVLPVSQLLTADRLGILAGIETDAAGTHEVRWDGQGPFRDRFSAGFPPTLRLRLQDALRGLGLPGPSRSCGDGPLAQMELEREFLAPLRAAVARGEVVSGPRGLSPAAPGSFERRHEATWFAELLLGGAPAIARAARMARLVTTLEPHLKFRTSGSVHGYEVQRAELPLSGHVVTLHVLRDAAGVGRLARAALDRVLSRSRDGPGAPWRESPVLEVHALEERLRAHNVPVALSGAPAAEAEAEELRAAFARPNPYEGVPRLPGERVVAGIAAAPGRASGLARLGLEGREAADVEGAILVTASLRPDDGPFLRRAAGVVSTGGGVLSHAGLLAMQYGKPALVAGGRWEEREGAAPAVVCRRTEADVVSTTVGGLPVVERLNERERDDRIREGDLVTLDADGGFLCLFGKDRDALAVHDGLAQLVLAARRLTAAADGGEILALRGRRLRARHQLERLLGRMEDAALAGHVVSELLEGEAATIGGDPKALLRTLLGNAAVGGAARAALRGIAQDLARRHAAGREETLRVLPGSTDAFEILALRRDVVRMRERLETARASIASCGIASGPPVPDDRDLDLLAAARLADLRESLAESVASAERTGDRPRTRHLLALLSRIDGVLGPPAASREARAALERRLAAEDEEARRRLAGRWIVLPDDGGVELRPLVGSKAAALAECARLGEGSAIPGWFAVTDRAFREVLATRVPEPASPGSAGELTVAEAIERILASEKESAEDRSAVIRRLFAAAPLPDGVALAVTDAYQRLGSGNDPFVAIRSSAAAEDTEEDARPGEFDTFLFVRGSASVLEHLRLAWAGLWSPRALRAREAPAGQSGGVLVQRMVEARVSGVLHTVHVAASRPREMLVNAGLGLGEGVVSGLVAADEITIEKDESLAGDDLRFRYVTRDKRERVVFNGRAGSGTARVETLYHQRLRPALEYVELLELAHAAARLEAAFGHPLDVEFAIEGSALRLLQVRPVPAALAVWRETAERYPLRPGGLP